MFLVGLTGGIATGKSSVAVLLRNMGIEIIDADLIAREVVEPNKIAWKKIRRTFGESVFLNDGTLDRKALGQIIFTQPEKRQILNSITHPEIYNTIFWKCVRLFCSGHQFAVIDLPLLFESRKMVRYLHKTVVVACEPSIQLQRLMHRDDINEHDAMIKINAQMPLKEKVKLADYVINNNGDMDSTKQQVESIVSQLRSLKAHHKIRLYVIGGAIFGCTVLSYVMFNLLNCLLSKSFF